MKPLLIWLLCFVASVATAADPFKAGEPPFKLPENAPKEFAPSVVIKDGRYVLQNRQSVISTAQRPEATLKFTWQWTKGVKEEDGKDRYHEHLSVVVLTDGKQSKDRPFEILNGILVRFNPENSTVAVERFDAGVATSIKFAEDQKFVQNEKYDIQIVYSKAQIAVHVNGKEVVKTPIPEDFKKTGDFIVIYGREWVANVIHESVLTNVSIDAKKK